MARFAVGLSLVLWFTSFVEAQSDPQALAYAAQAMAVLTDGSAIADATLAGSTTRTVGSVASSGTGSFYAKGQYESRFDLTLDGGNLSEIRNSLNGPQGEWIGSDGTVHPSSDVNCQTDVAWFFPALSSLSSSGNSNQTLSYVGLETRNGGPVQHLRSIWAGQSLSTMDFFLDASTLLPVEADFYAHPDNNSDTNIPVQVLFSAYQNFKGPLIPTHIQQVFNGSLLLDLSVTNAVVNSGLPDTLFALQ